LVVAVVCLIVAVIATVVVTRPGEEPTTQPVPLSACEGTGGVYAGAADPEAVREFEDWRGAPVGCAEDFLSSQSWEDIATPYWWLEHWEPDLGAHHLVLSVPLLPDTGADLASGANGAYDHHFRQLSGLLVDYGMGSSTIRLGWEFNGDDFPWAVQPGGGPSGTATPANFAEYWRRVVTAMRGVPGTDFTFDWNVNNGVNPVDAVDAYPGDDYVDIIGIDAYDRVWGPHAVEVPDPAERWKLVVSEANQGLDYWAEFARRHGKGISVPEWGVSTADHGGGDNPYYMRWMLEWMEQNDVVYDCYFEAEEFRLMSGDFPQAAEVYRSAARDAAN
jgi:hypothetical protein